MVSGQSNSVIMQQHVATVDLDRWDSGASSGDLQQHVAMANSASSGGCVATVELDGGWRMVHQTVICNIMLQQWSWTMDGR